MEEYAKIKTVFTIHNIEYQGKYDMESLGGLFGLGDDTRGIMEYDGCINLMKAAIVCANVVTTVSPRYAQEILTPEYSHGLDRILNPQGEKLCGILNGIDYKLYDPAKDSDISTNFTWRSFGRKRENKLALQRALGLPEREDIPLLSVISRLASHKGLDLIREKIYNILGEKEIQLVVLGKGEPLYENFFIELENSFPSSVRALILYDRPLSKRIYAATDIFLMPSRSEPCGLSQMIASRYGAIPIVRATGGLYDSIKPYRVEGNRFFGNGFTFDEYSSEAFKESVLAAIELWYDEEKRYKLAGRIMRTDFSWQTSAREYIKMYEKL
jgi:starch synthase